MRRNYSQKRDSNKIFALLITILVLVCAILVYLSRHQGDVVIAKINNQKIYKSELDRKISEVFSSQDGEINSPTLETLPQEVIETFAKEVYLEKELASRARKSRVAKNKEIKYKIKETQNRIITNAYLENLIEKEISDEKVSAKYAELVGNLAGKKEYAISHIVVKSKDQASKIYKELKNSKGAAKFAEMARKYSIDQDSSGTGGNLGYILEDNIIRELSDIILKLKKNEISKPTETQFGWHIVRLDDARDAKIVAFESVKDNIKERLVKDQTAKIYNDIFENVQVKILMQPKQEELQNFEENNENHKAHQEEAKQE